MIIRSSDDPEEEEAGPPGRTRVREDGARRARREAYVETLLSAFPVLPFDLVTARVHARLSAQLASRGEPVGAHDLVIASTAIVHGLEVVTRDERSFPRIPGLSLIRW